jgi:hypothetical protein
VFVVVAHDGDVRIERGFIRAEDEAPEPEPELAESGETVIDGVRVNGDGEILDSDGDGENGEGDDESEQEPEEEAGDAGKPLPDSLIRDLTAHRTLGLRLALGEQPDMALIAVVHRRQFDRALRLRRLGKLEKMGLATEHAPGVWELSERMEPALRELGERGDVIRNMHKALKADGLERDPMTFQIHGAAPEVPITGRVVDKFLTDELGENLTVVVDGVDGRTHHIAGIDPARVEDARIGSVVEIGPAETASRPSDRTIATIAEGGVYRPSRHLEQAKFEGRVPGGDYDGYVDANVRRLEALRRAGIVERIDADQWCIPEDFETRAAAYDAGRNKQANIRILSTARLEQQIGADGATWLDRRLMSAETTDLAPTGFGQQVRDAIDRRREHHIDHGDATPSPNGGTLYRRNLLATLRAREIERIGSEMAATKNLPFRAASDGESVSGKFTGTVQLSSGKFAVVEQCHEFTLVPWRPVIDRQLGREVSGIVQGGSVSWQLGRQRGLSL